MAASQTMLEASTQTESPLAVAPDFPVGADLTGKSPHKSISKCRKCLEQLAVIPIKSSRESVNASDGPELQAYCISTSVKK